MFDNITLCLTPVPVLPQRQRSLQQEVLDELDTDVDLDDEQLLPQCSVLYTRPLSHRGGPPQAAECLRPRAKTPPAATYTTPLAYRRPRPPPPLPGRPHSAAATAPVSLAASPSPVFGGPGGSFTAPASLGASPSPGPGASPPASPSPTIGPHAIVEMDDQDEEEEDEECTAQMSRAAQASQTLRRFLQKCEGSSLRAWLRYFDTNNDQRISLSEFYHGMTTMGYKGDIGALFRDLDDDNSGELSLEEIHNAQMVLWKKFRLWAVERFSGSEHIVVQLGGRMPMKNDTAKRAARRGAITLETSTKAEALQLDLNTFRAGVLAHDWTHGLESMLFQSLDTNHLEYLTVDNFEWLDIDKKRQRNKEQARKEALKAQVFKRKTDVQAGRIALQEFKDHLKKKYGNLVRAWRTVLTTTDAMVVMKPQFLKAFAQIGWKGDAKLLWKVFDKDDSGSVSIDELDPQCAEIMAHFKHFVDEKFGNARMAFRALDSDGNRNLKQQEFVDALKLHGFPHPAKQLFNGLDRDGTKVITEDEVEFIDHWKPLPFLIAAPSETAKQEVRAALLDKYSNYLKAWRHAMDKDGSNRCNWSEFEAACKTVHYKGNAVGAWRAFDEDLSGFIQLSELDAEASEVLKGFRMWADAEFGSVRSAFGVFDSDGSGTITYKEFRSCCRIYGFDGSARSLFYALDTEGNGTLDVDEVAFLDEWEFPAQNEEKPAEAAEPEALPSSAQAAANAALANTAADAYMAAIAQRASAAADQVATLWAVAEAGTADLAATAAPAPRQKGERLVAPPPEFVEHPPSRWRLRAERKARAASAGAAAEREEEASQVSARPAIHRERVEDLWVLCAKEKQHQHAERAKLLQTMCRMPFEDWLKEKQRQKVSKGQKSSQAQKKVMNSKAIEDSVDPDIVKTRSIHMLRGSSFAIDASETKKRYSVGAGIPNGTGQEGPKKNALAGTRAKTHGGFRPSIMMEKEGEENGERRTHGSFADSRSRRLAQRSPTT